MEDFLSRLGLFTLLPLALGAGLVLLDRTATGQVRRAEAFLIPMFIVGVGGSGISGFIAHVFISDPVARSIGWEPGSPFQLEVGFANLAIGLLAAIAAERRDGFREATVIAATVFGVGATIVHLIDIAATGNLAPGNTLQNVSNLAKPAVLIWFLVALRRAEGTDPPNIVLRGWMIPVRRGSVAAVAIGATAFSVGYATGMTGAWSAIGIGAAVGAFWVIVGRAPTHRAETAS